MGLLERFAELEATLGAPEVLNDKKRYRELTQEHAYLLGLKRVWEKLSYVREQIKGNGELLEVETDEEFLKVLAEDNASLKASLESLEHKLETLLVPPNPDDSRNTIVELRAGTGGDEAALFVGDCVRMYKLFAEKKGWRYEELSCTPSERGGFKEYVMVLSGNNVHRYIQYEGGTHRVQRVPETEAQGRVHTSAITVAVLMEPGEEEEVVLDEKDLRIDTYRASGAGGQHVNTTDSAVRITYIPSGVVAYCSEEKSQHQNREKAMRLLVAKIAEEERRKKQEEESRVRAMQVGTGDRSGRIRTYNFPQNRITDHRINFTRYNLDHAVDGELEEITEALVAHYYHEALRQ